jgi:hypothetical protein
VDPDDSRTIGGNKSEAVVSANNQSLEKGGLANSQSVQQLELKEEEKQGQGRPKGQRGHPAKENAPTLEGGVGEAHMVLVHMGGYMR